MSAVWESRCRASGSGEYAPGEPGRLWLHHARVIIMGVSWYIAGVTAWPVVVVLFLLGAMLGLLLTISGRVYRCGSCEYTWSYRDAEDFKKEKQSVL